MFVCCDALMIVVQCYSGLSRKMVWVNLGFYAVSFTLNQLSYILFVFVLSCTFWKKVRKTSAHGKNLHKRPLFTPHTVSPQSGTCSSLQAIACFQGAAELTPRGYLR